VILGSIYERNAACYPHQPAVLLDGRSITHSELLARIRKVAHAFAARGLRRQDRIAILAQNCLEYVEMHGAGALAGFVTVGLNYRLSVPELAAILRDCEPHALVFESVYSEHVAELRASMSPDVKLLCIGEPPDWAEPYEPAITAAPDLDLPFRAQEADTVFLIYTSGTTSRSKGVMLGNAGQLEQARILALAQSAMQNDRMLIVMPLYHIGGTTELLTYLLAGATVVLHRAFNAREILESIVRHRVTSAHLAPTMIQMMLDVHADTPYDMSSLRTIVYASAPMPVALSRRAQAAFGPIFMQIYGMTEHAPGSALLKHEHLPEGDAIAAGRLASAGHPLAGTEMRIVRDDGTVCATGEVGEVQMRSLALMQGYWRNPEATSDAIGAGWMCSGDMGYFDDENYLFIVDRKKDVIVSGGENIYSREVEEALLLHPAVAEAAVIGVPDPKWGEAVKAFVAFKPGAGATVEELVSHCRTRIASYKKPASIEFMPALPRITSTLKIDKKRLREPFWAGLDRRVS